MPLARTIAKAMSDDELIAAHDRAQESVARLVRQGHPSLTGSHIRMHKATGREIRSRAKYLKGREK